MSEAPVNNEQPKPLPPPVVEKKSDLFSVLGLVFALLNLAAIGGFGFFLKKLWVKTAEIHQEVETVKSNERKPASVDPSLGKEPDGNELGILFPMESFLVNIPSDQGTKFLQAQMELELDSTATEEEVSTKRAILRDAIILMLSSKHYRDLRSVTGMKELRAELIKSINGSLTKGKVKDIYFTQFHFN